LWGSVEQFKAVVRLVDGSRLHLNEVWLSGNLHKYAYYWLTPTDDVLYGWLNAPHHQHIPTAPHHVHTPEGLRPSQVRSLHDLLALLEVHLGVASTD
jgi:L-amino acid N-acyltransferase YncA